MSGVGGVGSNNNYFPGAGAPSGVGGPGSVGGSSGTSNVVTPSGQVQAPLSLGGNLTGVAYSQPSPLDPSHLVLPVGINDSTNVDITACLVLLIQTANQLRKDQREEWIKESQNALATSNNAADLQKQAATAKFIGEAITNGASAAVSIGQAAVSIGQGAKEESSMAKTEAQANSKFGSEADIKADGSKKTSAAGLEEDPEINNQAHSIISEEGLTAESIGGESLSEKGDGVKTEQKALKSAQKTEAKQVQTEGGTNPDGMSDVDQAKADAKANAKVQESLKERAQYVAQVNYSNSSAIQAKAQAATQFLNVMGSVAKMGGSAASYQGDLLSADAAKERALADFQNTAAANQLDFSNELRDFANSILSTLRDVESARHAASNAIANI